jgi:hypothetical protein
MRPRVRVVSDVRVQDHAEPGFGQHDDVIETGAARVLITPRSIASKEIGRDVIADRAYRLRSASSTASTHTAIFSMPRPGRLGPF